MRKKKEIEKEYFTVCYLTDKILLKKESVIKRTEPFAIKFTSYEQALNNLFEYKLNYFLTYSKQKTVREKLMNLEEIVNTMRSYLEK